MSQRSAKWHCRSFPVAHAPVLEYEHVDGNPIAIGTLSTGQHVQMWTLERGSKRELLFLAFMAEFMPPEEEE